MVAQYRDRLLLLWRHPKDKEEGLGRFLEAARGGGVVPEEVLCLGQGQGSRDMLGRLAREVFGREGMRVRGETFHGFSMKFLNRDGYRLGLQGDQEIIARWQEFLFLKALIPSLKLEGYPKELAHRDGFIRILLRFLNHLQGQGVTPSQFACGVGRSSSPRFRDLAKIYEAYGDFGRSQGYLPLEAVVSTTLELFSAVPSLLEEEWGKPRLLIVDELDRLKGAERELALLLAGRIPRVLFLAQEDSWDSSQMGELVPEGMEVVPSGEVPVKVRYLEYQTGEEEAWGVARRVAQVLGQGGIRPGEIALSSPDSSLLTKVGQALEVLGVPFRWGMEGNRGQDPVLALFLAYFRGLQEPADNDRQLRWLSSPLLGLDQVRLRRCYYRAEARRERILDILAVENPSGQDGEGLHRFISGFFRHKKGIDKGHMSPGAVVEEFCREYRLLSSFLDNLAGEGDREESLEILGNLREFIHLVQEWDRVHRLLGSKGLTLDRFLADLEGALPYFDTGLRKEVPTREGVALVSLRDTARQAPRVAFLLGMARDLFPPARNPNPLLSGSEWSSLQELLPRIAQLPEEDPFLFRREQESLLARGLAAARDWVQVSWAKAYEQVPETGPSELLPGTEGGDESPDPGQGILWPEPKPGAGSLGRLGTFYLHQVQRLDPAGLEGAQAELTRVGLEFSPPPTEPGPGGRNQDTGITISHYSPTAVNNYLACPRRYFYANLLGLSAPAPSWAQFGTLVHKILESFHRRYPSLAGVTEGEAAACLDQIVEELWQELAPCLGQGLVSLLYRRQVETICRGYLTREVGEWEQGRRATPEVFLDFFLEGRRFRGRIDRLDERGDGTWEIIDYKLGGDKTEGRRKKDFLPPEGEPPEDLQLVIYYLGGQAQGFPPSFLTWYQLSQLLLPGGKVKRSLEVDGKGRKGVSSAELVQARELLLTVLAEMERGTYPPSPRNERTCSRCTYHFACPGAGEEEEEDD